MVEWKSAFGFRGLYEISNDGQVMRIATHGKHPKPIRRPLQPHKKPNGYMAVDLQQDQERYRSYVHRLVWQTFRGEIPDGLEINHRNGVKHDNRLENLELITRPDNMLHSFQNLNPSLNRKMGSTHHKAKLTEDDVKEVLRLSKSGTAGSEIAELFGVSKTAIYYILNGRNWKQITGLS